MSAGDVPMLLRIAAAYSDQPDEHFFFYDAEGSGESDSDADALLLRLVIEELESYPGAEVAAALIDTLRPAEPTEKGAA